MWLAWSNFQMTKEISPSKPNAEKLMEKIK